MLEMLLFKIVKTCIDCKELLKHLIKHHDSKLRLEMKSSVHKHKLMYIAHNSTSHMK